MSGQDIAQNSGFTGNLTKSGLGIGSTAAELSLATPDGTSGTTYAIDGIAYYLADDATVEMSAMATQAVSTSCLYLVMLDSSGTLTTKKGTERLTADLGVTASLQWPQPDADTCPIGGFKVATNASTTFTGATTDLDDAGVTDTYYDFAHGVPLAPQVA
jgi:hypothetical protein